MAANADQLAFPQLQPLNGVEPPVVPAPAVHDLAAAIANPAHRRAARQERIHREAIHLVTPATVTIMQVEDSRDRELAVEMACALAAYPAAQPAAAAVLAGLQPVLQDLQAQLQALQAQQAQLLEAVQAQGIKVRTGPVSHPRCTRVHTSSCFVRSGHCTCSRAERAVLSSGAVQLQGERMQARTWNDRALQPHSSIEALMVVPKMVAGLGQVPPHLLGANPHVELAAVGQPPPSFPGTKVAFRAMTRPALWTLVAEYNEVAAIVGLDANWGMNREQLREQVELFLRGWPPQP
jgi:hypothetical protein